MAILPRRKGRSPHRYSNLIAYCVYTLTSQKIAEDYDHQLLMQFTKLFPHNDLAKLLVAYFAYHNIRVEEIPIEGGPNDETTAQSEDEDYAALIMVR